METIVYDTKDIIYALATPWGNSAIAVIRISGEGSIGLLSKAFSRPEALIKAKSHSVVHGKLVDSHSNRTIDEALISVFASGRGYTGEEGAEISIHGNMIGIQEVLALLGEIGMRPAAPGEFTFRAFMHGKMDLTRSEAVRELIDSRTSTARALALDRLEGALYQRIESIKQKVLEVVSIVELQLDYAEDEISQDTSFPFDTIEQALSAVRELLGAYSIGKLYAKGARLVIAGSTNAGKSSLFNLLLKQERSIVSDVHGTTRDFIEAEIQIEGIPVRLYDTAGLRESTEDSIEREGIHRTNHLVEQADLIVLMLDGTDAQHARESIRLLMADPRCIVVWNKADVAAREHAPQGSIAISAKTGTGIKALLHEIVRRLTDSTQKIEGAAVVIESQRQYDALLQAQKALEAAVQFARKEVPLDIVAVELDEALEALGTLTGEVVSEDILERIFSNFCVGK